MFSTVQRAVLLVVISAALGLVANAVSPRRIPYLALPKSSLELREILSLNEAKQAWTMGATFFLDARLPVDYEAGHIAGALNLPSEQFSIRFPSVAPLLTPHTPIVVYCDGEKCELSHELALRLRQLGFQDVRILINGWTVWRDAGQPTQQGCNP